MSQKYYYDTKRIDSIINDVWNKKDKQMADAEKDDVKQEEPTTESTENAESESHEESVDMDEIAKREAEETEE